MDKIFVFNRRLAAARNSSILGTTNWTPYLLIMSNENIDKNGKILFSCTFSLDYFTE